MVISSKLILIAPRALWIYCALRWSVYLHSIPSHLRPCGSMSVSLLHQDPTPKYLQVLPQTCAPNKREETSSVRFGTSCGRSECSWDYYLMYSDNGPSCELEPFSWLLQNGIRKLFSSGWSRASLSLRFGLESNSLIWANL